MKNDPVRRTNAERSAATRQDLLAAALDLFRDKGYEATGTPEIVSRAGLTRGALYHHFGSKQALFRAVIERESAAVAREIERATSPSLDADTALIQGGYAFLQAMAEPGRTRMLLLEAPAVLGRDAVTHIEQENSARTLYQGVVAAIERERMVALPIDELVELLAAMFDRAALAIEAGGSVEAVQQALEGVLTGLLQPRVSVSMTSQEGGARAGTAATGA